MILRYEITTRLVRLAEKLFNLRLVNFYRSVGFAPSTVIDVGANRGQSVRMFKRLNQDCSIHALEPCKQSFHALVSSGFAGTTCYNFAASDLNGFRLLRECVFDETSTLEKCADDSRYAKTKAFALGSELYVDSYMVKCVKLCDFIKTIVGGKIDLIKIDAEGHEYAVLKGLFSGAKHGVERIQVEVHDNDQYAVPDLREITRLVEENGYRLEKKIRHYFGSFYELIFRKETR